MKISPSETKRNARRIRVRGNFIGRARTVEQAEVIRSRVRELRGALLAAQLDERRLW